MKQTRQFALLTITLGLLSACSTTTRQAPVVDRIPPTAQTVRPVAPLPEVPKEEARGLYTVKKGDTLLRISLDHGQNYRDVVAWNNLSNPNDIKVDQVLRVAPPDHVAGVQTSPVAMPPSDTRPVSAAVPKKSTPRGDKRPYTDATLAEMQKGEGAAKAAEGKPDKPERVETAGGGLAAGAIAPGAIVTATDDEKLSWMWPSDGRIVATFDEGKNKGIDIAGKAGQQVMAAGAGKVMYAGSGIRGYGNLVIVKHSNSLLSAYAHNRSIVVKEGQTVTKGEKIAEMGDSDADSVKLHFEIRQQGKPVDPSRFLPTR
jgi:lipoprotein NlpD